MEYREACLSVFTASLETFDLRRLVFNTIIRATAIRFAERLNQQCSNTQSIYIEHSKEAVAGHVTAGGTVCLEALSQSGSRDAWHASYDVVSVLQLVPALHFILPLTTGSPDHVPNVLHSCKAFLFYSGQVQ